MIDRARHLAAAASIALMSMIAVQSAFCQSSADVENLMRNSKYIDRTRPVKAFVGAEETVISTYCDHKATDQDCKINALLLMKEMVQRFKTIHRMRVNFFDPKIASSYRSVVVSDSETELVDRGKPVSSVLSSISLTRGSLAPKQAASKPGAAYSNSALSNSANNSRSEKTSFITFSTRSGEISLNVPAASRSVEGFNGHLLDCIEPPRLTLWIAKVPILPGQAFEDLVRTGEASAGAYKNFRKLREQNQTVASFPAVVMEGTFDPDSKVDAAFVHVRENVYYVVFTTTGASANDNALLVREMLNSLRIRS